MPSATVQADKECPLCLEPLDLYEKNFYPCKCGYQVCQFCWNRIKEDENNLCPACRHPYTDVPVDLRPVSSDEWKKILSEKKKRDQQKKTKIPENRKHLVDYRVVQKNLVLIHGFPLKLADTLKKSDYFGQFGKVYRIVVGNSPNGTHTQNPSVGVYVTYYKEEDAVKAITNLHQRQLDGRTLKASLGTTKYCSLFLQNKQCLKQDCMYLHHVGETEASFTKEDMAAKKHEEYERKACDEIIARINLARTQSSLSPHNDLAANQKSYESVGNEKINEVIQNTTVPTTHRKSDQNSKTNTNEHQTIVNQNSCANDKSLNVNIALRDSQEHTPGSIFSTFYLQRNENSLFSNDDEAYMRVKTGKLSENLAEINVSTQNSNDQINLTKNCDIQSEQNEKRNDNELSFEIKDDDLGFDPFAESSKGLEDLVRQEKEEIQKNKVSLRQLQQTNGCVSHRTPPGLNTMHTHTTQSPTPVFYQKDQFYHSMLPESRRFCNSQSTNVIQQTPSVTNSQPAFACWMERMGHETPSFNARSIPVQVPNVYYNSSLLNKWSPSELNICLNNSRNCRSQPFVQLQTNYNGNDSYSALLDGYTQAPVTNGRMF